MKKIRQTAGVDPRRFQSRTSTPLQKGNKCEHDMLEFSRNINKKLKQVKEENKEVIKEMKYNLGG